MSNRNYPSGGKIYTMSVKPVLLNCNILIGASGAVTSFTGGGIQSIVRNGVGLYTINFQANTNFNGLHAAFGSCQSPSSGLSLVSTIEIQNAPNAAVQSLSAPHIQIKTLDAAGALVNPASGSTVSAMIYLSDSSVLVGGE